MADTIFNIPNLVQDNYNAVPAGMVAIMEKREDLFKKLNNDGVDRGKKAMVAMLKNFNEAFKTTIEMFLMNGYTMELLYKLLWDIGISRAQDDDKLPNLEITFRQLSKKTSDSGKGKFLKYFQIYFMSVGLKLVQDKQWNSVIERYRGIQVTIKDDDDELIFKVNEYGFIPQIMYALSGATKQAIFNIVMSQEETKMNIAATIIGYEYYKQTKGFNKSMSTLKKKVKSKRANDDEIRRSKLSKREFIADQMGGMLNILSKGFNQDLFKKVQHASYLIGREICRIDLARIANNANLAAEFMAIVKKYEGEEVELNEVDDEIKKAKDKLEAAEKRRKANEDKRKVSGKK